MVQTKYQYQIVAYEEYKEVPTERGYIYTHPCDIVLVCTDAAEALKQAQTLVPDRRHYEIFNVTEMQS